MTDSFPEFCKTCIHRGEGTGGAHCLPCEVRYNVVTKEPRPSEYLVDYKVTESPSRNTAEFPPSGFFNGVRSAFTEMTQKATNAKNAVLTRKQCKSLQTLDLIPKSIKP